MKKIIALFGAILLCVIPVVGCGAEKGEIYEETVVLEQGEEYRLEKDTHLSEKTVNRWHNGKTQPTVESLIRLSKYFGCSVDFLLGRV